MSAAAVIQAGRPEPGSHVGHIDVPFEARTMAASLVAHAQRIHRAQGNCATLAELEAAEHAAGQLAAGAQALRNNLRRQIAAAKQRVAR